MLHILIVDDEHHIVNYLSSLFTEHRPDEFVLYKAYSGKNALEIAHTTKIDIAFLDIQMPGINGLAVGEELSITWPKSHIIFLSAYNNFDYIYQAGKLPNVSYLLKTEKDSVILSALDQVISDIYEKNQLTLNLQKAQEQENLLHFLIQQDFLRQLLTNPSYQTQNLQLNRDLFFTIDFSQDTFLLYFETQFFLSQYDSTPNHEIIVSFLLMFEHFFKDKLHFSLLDFGNRNYFCVLQPSTDNISPADYSSCFLYLKEFMDDAITYCQRQMHQNVAFYLYEKPISQSHLCETATYLLSHTENQQSFATIIYHNDLDSTDRSTYSQQAEQNCQRLSLALSQGNESLYFAELNKLRDFCISEKSMHNLFCVRIYETISLMLLKYIDEYKLTSALALQIALYPLYFIHDFANWKKAYDYLFSLSQAIFTISSNEKTDKNTLIIAKIKKYINDHLGEALTLSNISSVVNYNESYISRLFKQTTGIGVSEYINQARLKRAKELLSTTNDSIQAIAYSTGFDTSQYFSSVFKKGTGFSPTDYRINCSKIL